jgi:hypothetical protein
LRPIVTYQPRPLRFQGPVDLRGILRGPPS